MVNFLKNRKFFLLALLTAFFIFSADYVLAGEEHNIRGLAYNSTYGYISFNCLDDGYAGRFPFRFTFPFYIEPCADIKHGVNLDANNNFSGEAWNSVLGFITFSSSSTPPASDFRTLCNNDNSCTAANSCTACYNEVDQKIYGYMQIVSTGAWIRLDNNIYNPSPQITNYLAPDPGIFSGYTGTSFGPISFNCADSGACTLNNYRVWIGPLEVRQMTAPNWAAADACSSQAKKAVLKWNRRSGRQTGYQIILSTQNSTSTGVIFDSGYISTLATQAVVDLPYYDTPYYWFLRLWDENNQPNSWRQFNVSGTKDWITDNYVHNQQKNPGDWAKTFTSYKHEFPLPSFSWSPEEILVATTTNSFISSSRYYNGGTVQNCSGSICSFLWSISDPSGTITFPTAASTSIMFTRATNTVISLSVTDGDIYTCATSTILNVNYALPLWKEIKADN